ncbi:MAG: hypothetical protein GWN30_19295 [Gammaproteobacteria bacterium]|nr:hypothetical protein [Gammaproteobacteria bacterium]
MDDTITIIEGPPPTFEAVNEYWSHSLVESPNVQDVVVTRLRTFDGPALIERCYRAWKENHTMFLEFKDDLGVEDKAPIIAARHTQTDQGDMVTLWVRIPDTNVEIEFGYEEDETDLDDEDWSLSDFLDEDDWDLTDDQDDEPFED